MLSFWLRAYDSTIVRASTDAEAFHLANPAARRLMRVATHPDEIDLEDRREGHISLIDRLGDGRCDLAEAIAFYGDRPFHSEARQLVAKIAGLDGNAVPTDALARLQSLIAEARAVPTNCLNPPAAGSAAARPWSVDQVYEYRGDPHDNHVTVVDEAGIARVLDPRRDLRNHSPTGFAWGYTRSGPAQLALAILCHALNSDERAEELYERFKDDVILHLDQEKS